MGALWRSEVRLEVLWQRRREEHKAFRTVGHARRARIDALRLQAFRPLLRWGHGGHGAAGKDGWLPLHARPTPIGHPWFIGRLALRPRTPTARARPTYVHARVCTLCMHSLGHARVLQRRTLIGHVSSHAGVTTALRWCRSQHSLGDPSWVLLVCKSTPLKRRASSGAARSISAALLGRSTPSSAWRPVIRSRAASDAAASTLAPNYRRAKPTLR